MPRCCGPWLWPRPPPSRACRRPVTRRPSRPDPGGWKITVTPSITQALAYDDNILFLDVADLESRTSPGLAVKLEDDRTTLDAQAVLDILRYQTHDELDRHNTRLSASARHASPAGSTRASTARTRTTTA